MKKVKNSRHALFFQVGENESLNSQLMSFHSYFKKKHNIMSFHSICMSQELMCLENDLWLVGLYLVTVSPGIDNKTWGNAIDCWKADIENKKLFVEIK